VGDGDGISDGLGVGIGVVGKAVGDSVGNFVGLHVVHDSVKLCVVPSASPYWNTSQLIVDSGGVLLQSLASPPNAATTRESPAISQLSPSSASNAQ